MKRKCKICDKEFNAKPFQIRKGNGIYCSRKCFGIGSSQKYKGENSSNWKGGKPKRICEECGITFTASKTDIKNGNGKFCSRKCKGVWASKNRAGKNSTQWKPKIKFICIQCNKEFGVIPSIAKFNANKFCSRKCRGKWQSINIVGKNNPCWKGGVTPIVKLIRCSQQYENWRISIFNRDNYTCQKCGIVGGKMVVHHIEKFSAIISHIQKMLPLMPLYEASMIYKPLWDMNNGITLCRNCHKKEHRKIKLIEDKGEF